MKTVNRSRSALFFTILSLRVFWETVIAVPESGNAGWLGIAAGTVLGTGLMAALLFIRKKVGKGTAAVNRIGAAALVYDASVVTSALLASVQRSSLGILPRPLLLIVTILGLYGMTVCGRIGVCGAARLYLGIAGMLLAVVTFNAIPSLRVGYLAPPFGSGMSGLIQCAVRTACILLVTAAWPLWGGDGQISCVTCAAASGGAAAVGAALCTMLTPIFVTGPRTMAFRLDALLSNGRLPPASQLPLTLIWYSGLVIAAAGELSLSSSALGKNVPKWLVCAAAALTVCFCPYSEWGTYAFGALMLPLAVFGKKEAEK